MKIFKRIKETTISGSIARALIYTIGHICIAMICNIIITGASINLAVLDALIEPIINGLWYFTLDRIWFSRNIKNKS